MLSLFGNSNDDTLIGVMRRSKKLERAVEVHSTQPDAQMEIIQTRFRTRGPKYEFGLRLNNLRFNPYGHFQFPLCIQSIKPLASIHLKGTFVFNPSKPWSQYIQQDPLYSVHILAFKFTVPALRIGPQYKPGPAKIELGPFLASFSHLSFESPQVEFDFLGSVHRDS